MRGLKQKNVFQKQIIKFIKRKAETIDGIYALPIKINANSVCMVNDIRLESRCVAAQLKMQINFKCETLFEVNVNDHVEKKNGLSYLSWPYAWAEVKKCFPEANYKVY